MKPFILEKHAVEYPLIRELQKEELEFVSGGDLTCEPGKILTVETTPNCDGGPDECDIPSRPL
ncbi:MAG: hypothetical protein ACXW12_17730 [Burkholderiales bacterium]